MERKYKKVYKIANAIALSADWTSDPIVWDGMSKAGLTYETTGVTTNTGNFKIQIRAWKDANNYSGWIDFSSDLTVTLASADISQVINITELAPFQVRIVYTKAGTSAGTFTAWFAGESI